MNETIYFQILSLNIINNNNNNNNNKNNNNNNSNNYNNNNSSVIMMFIRNRSVDYYKILKILYKMNWTSH